MLGCRPPLGPPLTTVGAVSVPTPPQASAVSRKTSKTALGSSLSFMAGNIKERSMGRSGGSVGEKPDRATRSSHIWSDVVLQLVELATMLPLHSGQPLLAGFPLAVSAVVHLPTTGFRHQLLSSSAQHMQLFGLMS